MDLTNPFDEQFKDKLDQLEAHHESPEIIVQECDVILAKALSPRALFIKGSALNNLAQRKKSNQLLEEAINVLYQVLISDQVPKLLLEKSAEKCIDLMLFRGWNLKAIQVQKLIISKFDQDVSKTNRLGVIHLLTGQNADAKAVFQGVLAQDPSNGFAMAHLGFILKQEGTAIKSKMAPDEQIKVLEEGVNLLKQGVSSGIADGKFYFHLGDGLRRLGRETEADTVYKKGSELGIFLSFWQRSLYNVNDLKAQPIWPLSETGIESQLKAISQRWKDIRDEAVAVHNAGLFISEGESLQDKGYWAQYELYRQGRKNVKACAKTPVTCDLIDLIPEVSTNRRGQVKFSVMEAGTHVHAHSGPTNCRLRAHLGLKIPPGESKLRVADQFLRWKEGDVFVFDDSFDHEVWHDNPEKESRIVLILDLWHPDLSAEQKLALPSI